MSKGIYKKQRDVNKVVLATVRIILTVTILSLLTICAYFIIKDGWEAFFAWFKGKYFCLWIMIAVFVGTAAWWIYLFIKKLRGTMEDEK